MFVDECFIPFSFKYIDEVPNIWKKQTKF